MRDKLKFKTSIFLLIAIMAIGSMISLMYIGNNKWLATMNYRTNPEEQEIEESIDENSGEENQEENIVEEIQEPTTIDILSIGNVIIHQSQIDGAKTAEGYDFSPSFEYVKDMFSEPDITMAVLESTLNGGVPTGYPNFNSPDEIVDNMRDSGIDIINYASNHINDYLEEGLMRTIDVTREKGVETLGVQRDSSEKKYIIKEINGEKIGFISYTYETPRRYGYKTINSNILSDNAALCINSFDYSNLDGFYCEIENEINLMKQDGAKFIVTAMHWGEEYDTYENSYQRDISNRLNQLGVDVIIGGHPHVIQPFTSIVNENGHETFVIYSQGNSLSNQSEEEIGIAESEDGYLVKFTLEVKDEKLSIKEYNIIPTWVYKEDKGDGTYYHRIIPVEDAINNPEKYKLPDYAYERLKRSLDRTRSIIGTDYNN